MGYHASVIKSTLWLRSGAKLARAWAEYAAAAPPHHRVPQEMPEDLLAFLDLSATLDLGIGRAALFPESDKVSSDSHVHGRIECGAWRLFEPGGVLYLRGEDGEHFGLRVTETGVEAMVGVVMWTRADDVADVADDEDEDDERTETCARCAEDVPADDVGPGQLCSWCTQLCR